MTPLVHPATLTPAALLAECSVRRQRRSGPGGQHRNKVETAIVLVHQPTGITGEASERRSQAMNLKAALQRLRVKLAVRIRTASTDVNSPTLSPLWQSRVRGKQISVSLAHQDFPALLAEALDVVARCDLDLKTAGELLGCSPSQVIKFLKLAPEALAQVNAERDQRGLGQLR